MKRAAISLLFIASLLAGVISSCGRPDRWQTLRGAVWNTTYTIRYLGSSSLADSIPPILRGVEMSLSPFNPASRISAINANTSMQVDSLIARVMLTSRYVNRLSGGAFDPTLSPLINLWGFGYADAAPDAVPSDSAIAAALSTVGIADCFIAADTMCKKSPLTTFNFSAVTKGYGCDLIGAMLARNGVTDYMVEIGGELALRGVNDRHRPWLVMIEAPVFDDAGGRTALTTVQLTDCGVATSGNYHNYHDTPAGRVGHTISATTGRPVATSTLSATVVAPTCALADALATASMAMDAPAALAMLEAVDGVSGIIVTADTLLATPGFPSLSQN